MTTIAITAPAIACFGAFLLLLGTWIDGRRQQVLKHGQHPIATPTGQVRTAEEDTRGL